MSLVLPILTNGGAVESGPIFTEVLIMSGFASDFMGTNSGGLGAFSGNLWGTNYGAYGDLNNGVGIDACRWWNTFYDFANATIPFVESAALGTPVNSAGPSPATLGNSSTFTGQTGTADGLMAIEFSDFDPTTNGLLFELGGAGLGINISISGGDLIVQAPSTTTGTADISYLGGAGTFYFQIDYGTGMNVYWLPG